MPHKRNPTDCSLPLRQRTGARAGGSFLSAMVQEHQRGLGGWQAEWPVVAAMIQSTGVAIASMAETAEGLSVDWKRCAPTSTHKRIDFCRARHDAAGSERRT